MEDETKKNREEVDNMLVDDNDSLSKTAFLNLLDPKGAFTPQQKAKIKRLEFTNKTKRVLAQRVGYRCSCPHCTNATIGPGDKPGSVTLLGEAAHIYGAIQDEESLSPRKNTKMTAKEIISLDNGIWLCKHHHALVDAKESTYTAEILKEWKNKAEKRQSEALENNKTKFIEEFVFPNIDVKKGISSGDFSNKDWCLFSYLMSVNYCLHNKGCCLSFEYDDDGSNFCSEYQNWMSEHSIDVSTSGLHFYDGYQYFMDELRNIVNDLTGLVKISSYGLEYGECFETFCESMFDKDEEVLNKIIKKLSII
ncbi:MAG: HNH endonuclease [Bacilli bacterium]|nr:HNH endonuclease [Bacilli bacterium]